MEHHDCKLNWLHMLDMVTFGKLTFSSRTIPRQSVTMDNRYVISISKHVIIKCWWEINELFQLILGKIVLSKISLVTKHSIGYVSKIEMLKNMRAALIRSSSGQ